MGNERTRKLEAAVKHTTAELRDYAATMLGDGETIGTHQDVAARLRRIAETLTDALPSEGDLAAWPPARSSWQRRTTPLWRNAGRL
jgi:hypothetical protein